MTDNIPTLPTLYKTNDKGKIRRWNISIVSNDNHYKIVTTHGDVEFNAETQTFLDKKIQTHTRIIERENLIGQLFNNQYLRQVVNGTRKKTQKLM